MKVNKQKLVAITTICFIGTVAITIGRGDKDLMSLLCCLATGLSPLASLIPNREG